MRGSSGKKVKTIAAVEDVETFVKAASDRLLTRTLCDLFCAGVGQVDEGLAAGMVVAESVEGGMLIAIEPAVLRSAMS